MKVSTLLTSVKDSLAEDNVYRTDTFLLQGLNDGQKLISALSMFYERRSSVNITGTRNMCSLPTDSEGQCLTPLYVADSVTGERVNAVSLDEFEFIQSDWLGQVSGSASRCYTLLNPYNYANSYMVVTPIQDLGRVKLNVFGAFSTPTVTTTDDLYVEDDFVHVLLHYVRFYAFISEPARAKDALEEYKIYVQGLNDFVMSLKSRFPSGRDYEPRPVEFSYSGAGQTEPKPKQQTTQQQSQTGVE